MEDEMTSIQEVLEGKEIEFDALCQDSRLVKEKEEKILSFVKTNGNHINKIIKIDNIDNLMKKA